MAEHTPGPWRHGKPEHGGQNNRVYQSYCPRGCYGGHLVAGQIYAGGHPETPEKGRAEAEANGRLIAAAPDLLEAAEWAFPFVAQLEFLYGNETDDDGNLTTMAIEFRERMYALQRTLAKAKGEVA